MIIPFVEILLGPTVVRPYETSAPATVVLKTPSCARPSFLIADEAEKQLRVASAFCQRVLNLLPFTLPVQNHGSIQ